jgi:hypothetical protein
MASQKLSVKEAKDMFYQANKKLNTNRLYNITNHTDISYDITSGTIGGINSIEMICDVIEEIDPHINQCNSNPEEVHGCETSVWLCFPDFENNALFKMVNEKKEVMCKQTYASEENPFVGTWIIVHGNRTGELLFTNITDIPRSISVNFYDLSRYLKLKYKWTYMWSDNVNFTWMWDSIHQTILRSHKHKPIYECDIFKKEGMYCKYDGITYSLYIGDKKYDKTDGDLTHPVGKYGDLNVIAYVCPINFNAMMQGIALITKGGKITTEVRNTVLNTVQYSLMLKKNLTSVESDLFTEGQIKSIICKSCLNNSVGLFINPCEHLVCDDCYKQSTDKCPICSAPITSSRKVYLP